jgi:hypothetical protein
LIHAEVKDKSLHITTRYEAKGYGKCTQVFALYDSFDSVVVNGEAVTPAVSKRFIGGADITTWVVGI